MANWLNKPGSLNWANKKKLIEQIDQLEYSLMQLKQQLAYIVAIINTLEVQTNELIALKKEHRLTAKDIVHLKPLMQQCEQLKAMFCQLCEEGDVPEPQELQGPQS